MIVCFLDILEKSLSLYLSVIYLFNRFGMSLDP